MLKRNSHKIITYILVLIPISSLLNNQSISNKIFFGFLIIALSYVILSEGVTIKHTLIITVLVLNFVASLFITKTRTMYNLNDIFYLPLWTMLFLYLDKSYWDFHNVIIRQKRFFMLCIWLWNIVFLIILFTNPKAGLEQAHRTSASAFFVIVLIWYMGRFTRNNKIYLAILIPIYCVFYEQARIYLIVSMIIVCMIYYSLFPNGKRIHFYLTILPMLAIAAMFILKTSVGQRFVNYGESYYGGDMAALSSSRSVFWLADIKGYRNLPTYKKILGAGYNFVYTINKKAVNSYIWGHNDLIHIICTNGILGIYIYLSSVGAFIKKYKRNVVHNKLMYMLTICVMLFCASLDGLYHYTSALCAVPFLFEGSRIENRIIKE